MKNMVRRRLKTIIERRIDYKKAIIVLGFRQVGKTTLLSEVVRQMEESVLYINGDDPAARSLWDNPSQALIEQMIGDNKIVFIDEAQRLSNIGVSIKMIIDAENDIQVFISGSSSLDLSDAIAEPLTGRKWEYTLLPFSWNELKKDTSFYETHRRLEQLLITGMYPEIIIRPKEAKELLTNLASSYLYKDILELGGIRKPEVLVKLLRALAWQVGSEVSYNELAQTVGADKVTVTSYIDLLEKAFVIFRLSPFSRNLRNEIKTSRKIYFYDNGVRNVLINNLSPIQQRNDIGALWENFLVSERIKWIMYNQKRGKGYFWRNTNQAEIDYIEENDGVISTFEFKWNPKAKVRFPKSFNEAYHPLKQQVVHRDNYWDWLS